MNRRSDSSWLRRPLSGRWPRVCARLAFVSGLSVPVCAPDGFAGGTVFSSAVDVEPSSRVEQRTWTDPNGIVQKLELRRRTPDGSHVYLCRAVLDVCGSAYAVCKPHVFESFFGEDGIFLGYRVEGREPFTKTEHDPFSSGDYELLDRILRTPTHALSDLPPPRGASVGNEGKLDGIDGITGATIEYYAREAVPGAFYTSHAVWYFVQRSLPPVLKAWTLEWARPDDVRAWAARGETLKVWWFLDHMETGAIAADAAADLAYDLLGDPHARLQSAAVRYLRRAAPPFQASHSRAGEYGSIDDAAKPDFLQWWAEVDHADPQLDAAVRADLGVRAATRSPVLPALFGYLETTKLRTAEPGAWRETLRIFEEESPSTYLRGKARQLAELLPEVP